MRVYLFWTLDTTAVIQYVLFWDLAALLTVIFLRFIHVATASVLTSFLLLSYSLLCIPSSVGGHLGYFHLLALTKNACMDIHVQLFYEHVFLILFDA